MLLVNNINFKRNNQIILKDISLSITPKRIIHLSGENGVGKTTLLKILTNILEPDSGEIYWNGKNIKKKPFKFYKNLTFIMDHPTANQDLTVKENIFFWCRLFSSKINYDQVDSILKLLLLIQYSDEYVSKLSYGEIKKLELSRLIIEQKKLWILDEPFIGLDDEASELINETIENHIELGGMAIFTSHIKPRIKNVEKLNLNKNANI